jgi:DNA invertase Pin-like site-specific DNA recombinase
VYTRKSSEEGLDQAFNSLDAQREAGEAYVQSQAQEGWRLCPTRYDDGGFSGGTLERPGVQHLLNDIQANRIQIVVVYKVDRLTRSLRDFAHLVELFDTHGVSFASVTQPVNTTTSTGRLMLNVLLSFAQFEREVTGERIRDKIAASKQKGMWMGGLPPLGYDIHERSLVVNEAEADVVRYIYQRYVAVGAVGTLTQDLHAQGYRTKRYHSRGGKVSGGKLFSRGHLYRILQNHVYRGKIEHKGQVYEGAHDAIIDEEVWTKTQTLLDTNRQTFVSDARVASPSLLKGLLYDDAGHRMSPSHGRKGSRRYQYYISQAVLQYREHEAGSVARLPAFVLDQLVSDRIQEELEKEEHTQSLAQRLTQMSEQERQQGLRRIIQRVVVSRTSVRITLHPFGDPFSSERNTQMGMDDDEEQSVMSLEVPFTLVPRGGRSRMMLNGAPVQTNGEPNAVLIQAVVRGYQWREQLLRGTECSLKDFAKEQGVTPRYLMRLLRVSFLAPDILEAIVGGTQPATMTLERFRRPIPLEWWQQRQLFGFPSREPTSLLSSPLHPGRH